MKYNIVKRVADDHPDACLYRNQGGKITITSGVSYDEAFQQVSKALNLSESDDFEKGDLLFYKDSVLLEIQEQ